jgi:hypothetical protein
LITLWYAYLTFKLLNAQRSAPRTAAWETALRDLSLYMAQKRQVIWSVEESFPADKPDTWTPPGVLELFARRDAIEELYDHLLDVMGLLPTEFQKQVLGVIVHLVEAHSEIHTLAAAMLEAQVALGGGRRRWTWKGRRRWTWKDVERAHAASDDPERSEPWADLIEGRRFQAAREAWEQLSDDLDRHLRS